MRVTFEQSELCSPSISSISLQFCLLINKSISYKKQPSLKHVSFYLSCSLILMYLLLTFFNSIKYVQNISINTSNNNTNKNTLNLKIKKKKNNFPCNTCSLYQFFYICLNATQGLS